MSPVSVDDSKLTYLTPSQVSKFYDDGYLVIPQFLDQDEVDKLMKRTQDLLDSFDLEGHPLTKFTTGESEDESKHVGDDYFLNSGDKIRFFMEEDAVGKDGKLNRPKNRAVNKIGHGLYECDAVFREVSPHNPKLKAVARDLKFHKDPAILQSMVICKQPEIGGKVPEHNDSTFLYTDPPSAIGFWFALEACTPTNGALSFLPGSHKTTPISKRFVRLPTGGTGFEQLQEENAPTDDAEYVLETCDAGTLVLIHGSVLHKSEKNLSQATRYAYTFHMIESEPYAKYDEKNWLQPTQEMPFTKLFAQE
ncbi:phytanoyl-CoA dioxygenase [Dacryopinax primogenitus]|uniref:Phytanoyl-CoA dioxygenase n=1 Tax=Dacryopinax primogenitus (strain DJM 731) TaxID=1858805 RepID=M5FR32_DACPD|nr:phytanoyl-CoA dioxygenase [Dacryopinax primogenitus]EJT97314.1 phytanoyl-CoA dioxygenase [Dacryopinax primogenitus]